jgi:hypothetical protein
MKKTRYYLIIAFLVPFSYTCLGGESERIWAFFINEDASPATIFLESGGTRVQYQTGYKGSTIGPLHIPRDASITVQGKGVDARTVPASMFEANPCCIIETVKSPSKKGALALSLQFGPHPLCKITSPDIVTS